MLSQEEIKEREHMANIWLNKLPMKDADGLIWIAKSIGDYENKNKLFIESEEQHTEVIHYCEIGQSYTLC